MCLVVCLCVCLSVYVSGCLFMCLVVCLCVWLFVIRKPCCHPCRLSHNNLLSILAYSDDGDYLCLIYPYMVRRSLDKYLSDTSALPPSTRVRVAWNIASALDYLHHRVPDRQIVHRDVKR